VFWDDDGLLRSCINAWAGYSTIRLYGRTYYKDRTSYAAGEAIKAGYGLVYFRELINAVDFVVTNDAERHPLVIHHCGPISRMELPVPGPTALLNSMNGLEPYKVSLDWPKGTAMCQGVFVGERVCINEIVQAVRDDMRRRIAP